MLVFEERGKPEYPEKNLSEQRREPTTNSTHIWCQRQDLNPGHIDGRRALSPLLYPLLFCKCGIVVISRIKVSGITSVFCIKLWLSCDVIGHLSVKPWCSLFQAPRWSGSLNWESANTKKKAGEYWRGEKAMEVVIISLNGLFRYTSSWCNLWLVTSTLPQQVILVTQKEGVRLPCTWNRGIHNNFCVEQILGQWNPVNMDTKGTCHSVRIIRVSVLSGLSEKTSGTHVLSI